jgi:GDP-L-fucose synthase
LSLFKDRKVLVTGGTGLVGHFLVDILIAEEAKVRVAVNKKPAPKNVEAVHGDLTKMESCIEAVKGIDFVFHLAQVTGGVAKNQAHPAEMFTPNLLMNTQMLEAARLENVERYLFPSSICIYSDMDIFTEERGWDARPHVTNEAYGWAKRMGELQAQLYHKDYGMKIAIVRPTNTYGPYDNFDIETSHVIPAIIRKAAEKQDPLTLWGNSEVTRDFIYSKDVASGHLLALERYPVADPLNLATGRSVSIRELAAMILELSEHHPSKIVFDKSKPVGQFKRAVANQKALDKIGFRAKVTLEEGLEETIRWYKKSYSVQPKLKNAKILP